MQSNKLEYKLYNKSVVVCTNEWKQPKCHCDMLLLFPRTNIRHGQMQPILGRTWLEWIRLSRIFRAPFANLSLEIVKKWVDTISYLVFRGSSANLSPTCTFPERHLSRRHFKSMPVDLDYIKPFMGFCTTLTYSRVCCLDRKCMDLLTPAINRNASKEPGSTARTATWKCVSPLAKLAWPRFTP